MSRSASGDGVSRGERATARADARARDRHRQEEDDKEVIAEKEIGEDMKVRVGGEKKWPQGET